jgi:hypothetical protein
MSRVDVGSGRSEATCEANGCSVTTEGRPSDGWPESEGWAVKMDDTSVFTTASFHDYCPDHACLADR